MKRASLKYVPIDEILARPRTKIARALRWFDWVGSEELFLACEAAEHEADAYMQALSRAVKSGEVERRGASNPYEYRLAARAKTSAATRRAS